METSRHTVLAMEPRRGLGVAGLYMKFLAPFFRRITLSSADHQRVREAAAKGSVVYVMGQPGKTEFLFAAWAAENYGFPVPLLANGIGSVWWSPYYRRLKPSSTPPTQPGLSKDEQRFFEVAVNNGSQVLFLRPRQEKAQPGQDFLKALVEAQRNRDTPIFLLPQLLLWDRRPSSQRRRLFDVLLGDRDRPGRIRKFFLFLRNYRGAFVKVGDAINLQQFVADNPGAGSDTLARKLRWVLRHYLNREQEIITGPRYKPPERIRDLVLRDQKLREYMDEAAAGGAAKRRELAGKAAGMVAEIAADMRQNYLDFMNWLLRKIWNRIYDGIDVDSEGLKRVREVAREMPLVFCPSHKSHVDYLVLSQVFVQHDMQPPHIAAGVNLSFWPLGHIFRRCGAFFIRRSFKGDRLYSNVFKAYVRRLLKEGAFLQFFIEGGRSRTGKLLFPKMGLLSMIVEAFTDGATKDVGFVPISVTYEKIVESASYQRELAGAGKQAESLGGLLRSREVLRSRYGRLNVEIAAPIRLSEFMAAYNYDPRKSTEAGFRALVEKLGFEIAYKINTVTNITPTGLAAAALLTHRARGLTFPEIVSRCDRIIQLLPARDNIRLTPVLQDRVPALRGALDLLTDARLLEIHAFGSETIYTLREQGRVELNYYKNNLIAHLVRPAIVSAAILTFETSPVPVDELKIRAKWLSRLFKYEFLYPVGASFETLFEETLQELEKSGVIRCGDNAVAVIRERAPDLNLLSSLLRDYLESYFAAAKAISRLNEGLLTRGEYLDMALTLARRLFVHGDIWLPESLSKANIENALRFLIDQEYVVEEEAPPAIARNKEATVLKPGPAASGERFEEFMETMQTFLKLEMFAGLKEIRV
ncbi:MAG: Glycerol-3-phosphate acyltransferase [Myxococcota bacterium]|nr:Glycerol-3-phosphate acyltransferase [Myxococcota bacterium]